MLWDYDHYKYLNSFSTLTVFIRQTYKGGPYAVRDSQEKDNYYQLCLNILSAPQRIPFKYDTCISSNSKLKKYLMSILKNPYNFHSLKV